MRVNRWIGPMVLLLAIVLVGCASRQEHPKEETGYQIYYINKEETAVVTRTYQPEGNTTWKRGSYPCALIWLIWI